MVPVQKPKRRVKAESGTTETPAPPPSKRRKRAAATTKAEPKPQATYKKRTTRKKLAIAIAIPGADADADAAQASTSRPVLPKPTPKPKQPKMPTRKLKQSAFDPSVPTAVRGRIVRARKQKMFIVERERVSPIEQKFTVIGSTGNLYTVTIASVMKCNCPDGYLRPTYLCKHVIMILMRVFHVDINDPILQDPVSDQKIVRSILSFGPRDASDFVDPDILTKCKKIIDGGDTPEQVNGDEENRRRPLDTSDCPICFESFSQEDIKSIAFCTTCGNNVHTMCFEQWKSYHPGSPTCVYCRTPWPVSSKKKGKQPDRNQEGYVNMATAVGLSSKRDTSTYHRDRYGHYAFEYEDEDDE